MEPAPHAITRRSNKPAAPTSNTRRRFDSGLANPPVPHNLTGNDIMKPLIATSLAGLAAGAVLLTGCASQGVKNPSGAPVTEMRADERGFVAGTGIESQDIVAVTDKMARSILGVPEIANATSTPRIALLSINNDTRFPINKDVFLTRLQTQLISKTQGKVRFLAREQMEALERERNLKREGAVTSTTDPNVQEFRGADYFLTGKLTGVPTRTTAGTSDYVLYTFQLIEARTSEIVWSDMAEIKKQGLEDAAYR